MTMISGGQEGFFFLNTANAWPSFVFTGLAVDPQGVIRLAPSGSGYAPVGSFMGGPFQVTPGPAAWFRLAVFAETLPSGAHVQFFTYSANSGTPPYAPTTSAPFAGWSAVPRDELEAVISSPPALQLWVGGLVRGNGTATPSISQIRVDYGRNTYLKHLPAIYRRNAASRDLLERFLALTQSGFGNVRYEIEGLPRLFDPFAAPASGYPSWLGWLSDWLAWLTNQHWTEHQARLYLSEAFSLYRLRGTVAGLRRYLKIYAGVSAHIIEPARHATLWSLGMNSTLGFSTMLAPGAAQAAVLGSTAILDGSSLPAPSAGFGSVLFSDLANRFCVLIFCGELTRPGALQDAKAVIEREKPAHTVCRLCVIAAAMRVGVQAMVGVNAIVGGRPLAETGKRLGHRVLAATDRECVQ
jgi:phage tail-like protein